MTIIEWSTFPTKHLILPYLDYESRCNLRTCSRDNKELVDSTNYVPSKIVLNEILSNMDEEKSILRLDIDTFTIWFIGKNEITRVERAWNEEPMEMAETKNENRVDVFKRFVDKFLKNGFFEAKTLEIVGASFDPSEHWRIKCSELLLISPGTPPQWIIDWLGKVESKWLKELKVHNWSLEGVGDLFDRFNVFRSIRLTDSVDLTDDQLEKIQATDLHISSFTITPEGIKKAFENYLKNGREGDEFIICSNFRQDFDPVELFEKGLKFQKKEGRFPEEKLFLITGGFSNRHGNQQNRICRFVGTVFQVRSEPKKLKKVDYILWPFTIYR